MHECRTRKKERFLLLSSQVYLDSFKGYQFCQFGSNEPKPTRIAKFFFSVSLDSNFLLLDVRSTLSSQNITDSTVSHKGEISPVSGLRKTDLVLHLIFVEQNISIWLFPRYSLWFLLNLPHLCNRFFLQQHYYPSITQNRNLGIILDSFLHTAWIICFFGRKKLSQYMKTYHGCPEFLKEDSEEVTCHSQAACILSYNH